MQTQDREAEAVVRIEYPREGDTLARPEYTFHIEAGPGCRDVEVSVDGGDWTPCREALGLWWFDWSGFEPGPHTLVALSRAPGGVALTRTRRFVVE